MDYVNHIQQTEIEDIKEKAIADNSFMKAPNGNDSKLTEKQWLQVRTKAFREWFGDWELALKEVNDSDEKDTKLLDVSKVVDENGEPLVVYHGTKDVFSVFDADKIGTYTDSGMWGRGFYFSSDKSYAATYSNREDKGELLDCYLNIKRPLLINSRSDIPSIERVRPETDEDMINAPAIYSKLFKQNALNAGKDGVVAFGEEYVIFSSNQIKSATNNTGEFSKDNDDIRFRFIGEIGVVNLDKAEETHRLDNLKVARKMAKAKKDEKSIKMATGWERGPDSLWRYEVNDFSLSLMKDRESFGNHFNTIKKQIVEQGGNPDAPITFEKYLGEKKSMFEPLFKTYPSLKSVELTASDTEYLGYYSPSKNIININPNLNRKQAESTFNHEIQHVIQDIEGFTGGCTPTDIRDILGDELRMLSSTYKWAKSYVEKYYEYKELLYKAKAAQSLKNNPLRLKRMSEQFLFPLMGKGTKKEVHSEYIKRAYSLADQYEKDVDKGLEDTRLWGGQSKIDYLKCCIKDYHPTIKHERTLVNRFEKIDNSVNNFFNVQLYHKLSGEVEARNVSSRRGMTNQERRESLAKETEDVARKDQIILEGDLGLNVSCSMEKQTNPLHNIEQAVDEISKVLGVVVEKVESREHLPIHLQKRMNNKGRYPGIYDQKTDKVYVLLNEILNKADAKKTILHETLGHKGLRALKGKGFEKFLDDVCESIPSNKQEEYLKRFDNNKLLATEEYLAEFAEGYKNPNAWKKVKAIFNNFLRKIGINIKMSDADLMYTFKKAKNKLTPSHSKEKTSKIVKITPTKITTGKDVFLATFGVTFKPETYTKMVEPLVQANAGVWDKKYKAVIFSKLASAVAFKNSLSEKIHNKEIPILFWKRKKEIPSHTHTTKSHKR